MPSTYTSSLRLVLPATGELSNTWGTVFNAGATSLIDTSIAGTASITMTAADYTLSNNNGASDESRSMFLVLGGTPGASYQVICPAVSKLYFVTNNTGFAQTVKTAAGTGISVPNGARMTLRCDGTDVVEALNYVGSLTIGSLTLGSPLSTAQGGTGSTSTTYCSLTTNVTGTLPIANGGTGATTLTANNVILGNGTSAVQFVAPGANGNVLVSNGTTWTSAAPVGGYVNTYVNRYFTSATATFTVPTGVTSIRAYAVGKGGDAATFATQRAPGGGGGGFAFGDISVTPGASVTITIGASSTTVAIGATTYLTANAGSAPASASAGGAGGTASKDVSVTNGGAYTGGTGGGTTANNQCGAGASAGSPLGNGVNGFSGVDTAALNTGPGGSGIGGAGSNYGGGGGAGSAPGLSGSSSGTSGGGSGPQQANSANLTANGASRQFDQKFTDPFLAHVDGTGGRYIGAQSYISAGPGGGGAVMASGNSASADGPAYAGDCGGGGAANTNTSSANIRGMNGGILGGGGTAYRYGATTAGTTRGGDGGFGGGGGGACLGSAASGGTTTQGSGGGGCVVIYY